MAFDIKQYMIDLVRQLNLRHMDGPRRAQLADWKKKGVATTKQASWDPNAPLPSRDEAKYGDLTDDEAQELYQTLVILMRDLQLDSSLEDNKDVQDFIKEFVQQKPGDKGFIQPYTVEPIANASELAKYIDANKGDLARFFKNNDKITAKSLRKLQEALENGNYRTDIKAQEILKIFLDEISYYVQYGDPEKLPAKEMPSNWVDGFHNLLTDADEILKKLDTPVLNPAPIDLIGLGVFETSTNRPVGHQDGKIDGFFDRIISKDKLRDAVTARGGDIAKWIKKGLDESNYKEGNNQVSQKFDDRKRFFGRAESKVKGFFADTWDKLGNKHKRHIYQTNARFIVDALFKEKVKPADGLGKVLEKLDGIAAKQPVPVQEQIKWMKEKLGAMSNTTQFKEALTHGGQMQKIVNDIIAGVNSDGDMEKAMVTLETLAVMSSTMVTSGVREELHKMDFTIFSDPSLSFNKGGLGVLTKAIDKTLRFATLAVYEAGNFLVNAVKKSGGKVKKDKIAQAAGQAVTDDEMRRIQLMVFWNFVNSNANTDINIFKRHSEKQKAADAKADLKDDQGNPTNEFKFKINGVEKVRKDPTAQEVAFLQYMIKQGYAQAV